MMDRLSEALLAARDIAVEELEKEHGPYCSTLEGYGDIVRKLEKTRASVKACGKELEKFSAYMDTAEQQEMSVPLEGLGFGAAMAMFDVTRLYAGIRVLMATVKERHGGDLLDILEGIENPEEPEDEKGE